MVETTPTSLFPKKITDIANAPGKRRISDLRFVNIAPAKQDRYAISRPTIQDIIAKIARLKRKYSPTDAKLCKRDVIGAFELTILHRDLYDCSATEFAADDVSLKNDISAARLVLQFGRLGSPSFYQILTVGATERRRIFHPGRHQWAGSKPRKQFAVADNSMFVWVDVGGAVKEAHRPSGGMHGTHGRPMPV